MSKKEYKRVTTHTLKEMKTRKEKISMLTGYDYSMAKIIDNSGIDVILVGDSASNVMAGHETTLPITLDQIIYHASSVVRGVNRALVVVDLPFGSYQSSPSEAFHTAQRVMAETSCDAIKLEGGRVMAKTVEFLVNRGIPVMGHIGMLPQSFKQTGGYKVQGRALDAADEIVKDAIALEESGAFSIVIYHTW